MPTRDANFNFMIVTDYLYFNSLADVSSFVLDVASVLATRDDAKTSSRSTMSEYYFITLI